jgi:transketolase C-terminal domain/subunit
VVVSNPACTPEMRSIFGETLVELGREYGNLIVLDADLNTSSRTDCFRKAYPDRFLQIGIAEQNLFGVAAGLASTGFIPVPSTFAVFLRTARDLIELAGVDMILIACSTMNRN